jgi:hypothetical protein
MMAKTARAKKVFILVDLDELESNNENGQSLSSFYSSKVLIRLLLTLEFGAATIGQTSGSQMMK